MTWSLSIIWSANADGSAYPAVRSEHFAAARVEPRAIEGILAEIPPHRMSHISREFTRELLLENQRRLLAPED